MMGKRHIKLIIFLIFFLAILFNFDHIRSYSRAILPDSFKYKVKEIFFGKKYLEEVNFYRKLGYNVKIIPDTQFEILDLEKFSIANLDTLEKNHYGNVKGETSNVKKFFIEIYKNNLIITTTAGQIIILKDYTVDDSIILQSNLKEFKVSTVIDIAKINDELFVSFASKKNEEDECSLIKIARATLNLNILNFKIFFQTNECTTGTNALGGRIIPYKFKNNDGLLFTTAASDNEKSRAQNDKSFYGKIWFFSLDGNEKLIFSKGHRNPQGLVLAGENILSTEHGAYGGDEINKIEFGKNYGHPIASYGDVYKFDEILKSRSDYKFKKNHSKFDFQEPIFSFVPSIGISEIIQIPNKFSKYWKNNFFVTSLNGRTIYRLEFDENFTKLKYMEPIRIGERVRDIKYISKLNSFVLALEETGSIFFLKAKTN